MPHYSNQDPVSEVSEVRSLIQELEQATQSLPDEELKNKLTPHINELKKILPIEESSTPEAEEADQMLKNKQEEQNVIDRIMSR